MAFMRSLWNSARQVSHEAETQGVAIGGETNQSITEAINVIFKKRFENAAFIGIWFFESGSFRGAYASF